MVFSTPLRCLVNTYLTHPFYAAVWHYSGMCQTTGSCVAAYQLALLHGDQAPLRCGRQAAAWTSHVLQAPAQQTLRAAVLPAEYPP